MTQRFRTPASVWRNPVHFLAFGLGSGAVPVAPGTFGSVAALLLFWGTAMFAWGWPAYLFMLLATFLLGIWLCGRTASDIGVHDHGGIVWDEFVGLWITLFLAPAGWLWWITGFLLFRFFDVLKPWPIRWFDRRVPGGLGIMLDDVLAGLMAWIAVQLLAYVIT